MMNSEAGSDWERGFRARLPLYERLKDEVVFTLKSATASEGIKTHSVHGRVKSSQSISDKVRQKDYGNPIEEVDDIVGVRAVVLFLTDLPRLDEIVLRSFQVHQLDNKVTAGDPASFGYMSVHYVACLKDHHSGPRYDDLKGIRFEIQTRTILMDAWANVSHHLDYKGESSVPKELRKDFFALSGLFYVADQHFELFAGRATESQEKAEEELRDDPAVAALINLDTVAAYLAKRYPNREHTDRASISEFVEEITECGFESLAQLDDALRVGDAPFPAFEEEYPALPNPDEPDLTPGQYTDLGAARLSLALANRKFARLAYPDDGQIERASVWRNGADQSSGR